MKLIARAKGQALALALCAGVLAACESNITDPEDVFSAVPCVPPPVLLANVTPQTFTLSQLKPALLHAAGPMAAALESSDETWQLTEAITTMASSDRPATPDTACRLLIVASQALQAMPDTPATLPDRAGIHIVLLMAAAITKAGMP